MKKHRRFQWLAMTLGFATASLLASNASAVDIIVNYDPDSINPNDPTGAKLMAHAEVAAQIWEDLLPVSDTSVYSINFSWDASMDPCVPDQCTLAQSTAYNNIIVNPDAGISWFFDPTPGNDLEFKMKEKLYRDLTPLQKVMLFTGTTPPDLLEVGFAGEALVGNSAATKTDLLSVLLHELGHDLGIQVALGVSYEIPSDMIGLTPGILIAPDVDHIADPFALMASSIQPGIRKLPSAVDVLALADDNNYPSIDLKRKEYLDASYGLGPMEWHNPTRWVGGSVPDSDDIANVRFGGEIFAGGSSQTSQLLIGEDSPIALNTTLSLLGDLTAVNSTRVLKSGVLEVESTGELFGTLTIAGGSANFHGGAMEGATLRTLKALDLTTPGQLRGHGSFLVASLRNDGEIVGDDEGVPNAVLTITSTQPSAPVLDLDGLENTPTTALITAIHGDVSFVGAQKDDFHGEITVAGPHSMTFSHGLKTGPGSTIGLTGLGNTAQLVTTGFFSDVSIGGELTVNEQAIIQSHVTFDNASVALTEDAHLTLPSDIDYQGVLSATNLQGTIVQGAGATVQGTNNLSVDTYDWDGAGSGITTLMPSSSLTLGAHNINVGADPKLFTGTVQVLQAALSVRVLNSDNQFVPWKVSNGGQLYFQSVAPGTPIDASLSGSPLRLQNNGRLRGTLNLYTNLTNEAGIVDPAGCPLGSSGVEVEPIGRIVSGAGAQTFVQEKGASLLIDLTGTGVYQYDRILMSSSSSATVGGNLIVTLKNGFEPTLGNAFEFFRSGDITGQFDIVSLPPLTDPTLAWQLEYNTGLGGMDTLVLRVVSAP